MFENPRRGREARNFTTNGPKILDLKSSSEQIFSKNWRWVPLSIAGPAPVAWISLFLYVALMNSLQHFLPYKGWDKNSFTLENDTFHFRQFISHIPHHTWALELILAFVSGHPRLMISLRSCSDSSLAVSSWISSNLDYETGKLDCIRWTCLLF